MLEQRTSWANVSSSAVIEHRSDSFAMCVRMHLAHHLDILESNQRAFQSVLLKIEVAKLFEKKINFDLWQNDVIVRSTTLCSS